MMGMLALSVATVVTLMAVMQSGNQAYIKAMEQKAEKNLKLAKQVRKQSIELIKAREYYKKIYGTQPVNENDLINKKLLRSNYKNTTISKKISLNSTGGIMISSNNIAVDSLMNASNKKIQSIMAKKIAKESPYMAQNTFSKINNYAGFVTTSGNTQSNTTVDTGISIETSLDLAGVSDSASNDSSNVVPQNTSGTLTENLLHSTM